MSKLRILLRLLPLVLAFSTAALIAPGHARAALPCWKQVINDWEDGRIDKSYPAQCYREALHNAPADLSSYSSLPADLQAALQNAVGNVVPAGQLGNPSGVKYEKAVFGQQQLVRLTADIHHRDDDILFQAAPTGFQIPGIVAAKSPVNLPLPLIILAVVAFLLLAAGAAGMITRRLRGDTGSGQSPPS
ncbi:MAG: hypothetical protein ACXVZP_10850 [Gaiellaceae bacterium]